MADERRRTVTITDLERCAWQEVIANAAEKHCFHYSELFRKKCEEAEAAGDREAAQAFRLLLDLTFYRFVPESVNEPFQPTLVMDERRSATSGDLTDEELAMLRELAPGIEDAEMRARVADAIWDRKRDVKFAQMAIDSYLESARRLAENPPNIGDRAMLVYSLDRIERALRLSRMINDKQRSDVLGSYAGEQFKVLAAALAPLAPRLAGLLIELRIGEPLSYASIAKQAAERAEAQNGLDDARAYWTRQAEWLRLAGDGAGERAARIAAAETYVKKAALFEKGNPPNHLLISDCLERAIQAHRQTGGQKDRVDELHARLVAAQRNSVAELKRIEVGRFDATQIAQKTIAEVTGKPLPDALFRVALLINPPDVKNLRAQTLELMTAAPLISSLPAGIMSGSGKTVAKTPSATSPDADEVEAAVRAAMARQLGFARSISAIAISAAVTQIMFEHPVQLADLGPLVSDNPFVPADRAAIFTEGLHAGLTGNLLVSTHLLMPQIENSFREILSQHGVVPSKLNRYGIQEEMHLQELLYLPKFEEVFGADFTFDLKILLIDHGGPNLRHGTAHGLRSYAEFLSPEAVYFWCLTLRLCFPPLFQKLLADAAAAKEENH